MVISISAQPLAYDLAKADVQRDHRRRLVQAARRDPPSRRHRPILPQIPHTVAVVRRGYPRGLLRGAFQSVTWGTLMMGSGRLLHRVYQTPDRMQRGAKL